MRLEREVEPVEHTTERATNVVVVNSRNGARRVVVRVDWTTGSGSVEVFDWDRPDGMRQVFPTTSDTPPWEWMYPDEAAALRRDADRRARLGA